MTLKYDMKRVYYLFQDFTEKFDVKKLAEVDLESYINHLCAGEDGSIYAGGRGGYLVRMQDIDY